MHNRHALVKMAHCIHARCPHPLLQRAGSSANGGSEGEPWDGGEVGAPCPVSMSRGQWRLYYGGRAQRGAPGRLLPRHVHAPCSGLTSCCEGSVHMRRLLLHSGQLAGFAVTDHAYEHGLHLRAYV